MTEIRVASFNASLNRNAEGGLIETLSTPDDSQAQSVAEIIQRTDADVILVNEFDFDADGEAARLFQDNYLGVSQNGQDPVEYPYVYVAPSNTGVATGLDLDNDGATDGPGDAQGFGFFEGQFGFVIFSKYPIDDENVRTFQEFLWKDMPGNLLTEDPTDNPLTDFYSPEEIEILRLSSKNHVDVPVIVEGETVHILAAHPTPPVFDGDEDRNGKRNHDEIRFWSDYVDGADYIYDDNGVTGGLAEGERFVIVGDYNADPFDGDSFEGAANQLLDNPLILGSATDASITPSSEGGPDAAVRQAGFNETHAGDPAFDTADFGFAGFSDGVQNPDGAPGNLRVDYALPSVEGLAYLGGSVFWQAADDPLFPLAEFPTSDHRLVSVDLRITDQDRRVVNGVEFLGITEIDSGTEFEGTTLGGLSGIAIDPVTGTYLAISDDFSTERANRFYQLNIDLSDGSLDDSDVTVLDVTELDPNGFLPGFGTADTEGIALGQGGQIYISTERNNDGRFPQILEIAVDGTVTGELEVDDKFNGTSDDTGVRNNLGFESLTISPDQTTLWAATEGALTQDGERAGLDNTSTARIVRYDLETGEAVAEYVYEVDPIAVAPDPADAFADSGLVELLAIDNQGTLLALERSFSIGAEDRGYTGKLYLVRTQGATNVIGEDTLPFIEDDGELEVNVDETVTKTLLADLGEFGIVVDNIEGMTLGPVLEDGRQSLIIASDDNFSAFGPQANQFIALALDIGEIPTITPVVETPDEVRYDGEAPIVIGHRGASGELPEHTLGAYARAINDGADFIEPDLVSTSDGVLIARHEPWLATVETDENGAVVLDENGDPVITFASTDIAEVAKTNPDFMARLTTKNIGFSSDGLFGAVTGWFAEDFTLAEIKTLRAIEDQPELRPQSALFDGLFEIPTLDEIIDLVQEHEARTGEKIGIYPETKEPSYFDSIGLSLEENLIQTLVEQDFTDPDRIFIQSFEVENLLDLQENVMPSFGVDLPLVQLLFNAPGFATYDLVEEALTGGDFSAYASLGFDATTVSGDLFTPEGLELLADVYAEGIGPSLSLVLSQPGIEMDDFSIEYTSLVDDAHDAGLLVHAYTHRDENNITINLAGDQTSPEETYQIYLQSGIDGLFTDHPATGRAASDALFTEEEGPDSDDSAVVLGRKDLNDTIVVTAMKNGGLRVYDLEGSEIQRIEPDGVRYNNVDVIYNAGKRGKAELVVASDRENDTLAIFRVKKDGTLKDVTSKKIPDTIFGVDDGEATAYGLATYTSLVDGRNYVYVTQADGASIAQLELIQKGGRYTFETVRILDLPVPQGEDPADFQSEGIVIDRETGVGYVAVEEELGLLSFEAEANGSDEFKVVAPLDSGFFEPDLEGVSIHYGENGEGLILVSSQGDSTFVALDRVDGSYLGSFAIRGEGDIDGVEETDGIEIVSTGLPGFENGLLITQDGSNEIEVVFGDPEDGELQNFNTNFKYSDLGEVLDLFGVAANPDFDPRNIEPETLPNGVASGDVTEDSVVLWARSLALGDIYFDVYEVVEVDDDKEEDDDKDDRDREHGKHGWKKKDRSPEEDDDNDDRDDDDKRDEDDDKDDVSAGGLKLVARIKGEVTDPDVPVKVFVDGLDDGTEYVFKVTDAAGDVADGKFRTAEEDGYNGLTFGVTGDWRGELAPYPAISNAPEADLDFFVLHGDTIYADFPSPALDLDQAVTVEEFRTKYAEVYGTRGGENFFADLFATTAIYATIDDHEVTNDFAGGSTIGATGETEFRDLFPGDDPDAFVNDSTLYENGLQAFHDFHAIGEEFYGETGDPVTAGERKLYRYQEFGQDAANFILDQRSFRDEQLDGPVNFLDPNEVGAVYASTFEPGRTLLGEQQLTDLKADLLQADANGVTWKFIYTPEPIQALFPGINTDSWDGYNSERTELLKFVDENEIDNVVFVAADVHATYVNNLTYQEEAFGEHIATNAFEITTGSVAFDPPTGLFLGDVFAGGDPAVQAFFDGLPIAPDTDSIPDDKDDFLKAAINENLLAPFGYDPLGLNNGTEAESLIDAELIQGDYVASTTYGWTQFDIDAETQALTVTTYGIEPYTAAEAAADPSSFAGREPFIVSQFVVQAKLDTPAVNFIEATRKREVHEGTDAVDVFVFEPGDSSPRRTDRITEFEAGDKIDLSAYDFELGGGKRSYWGFNELEVGGRDGHVVLTGGRGFDRLKLVVEGDKDDVEAGLILHDADSFQF